VHENIGARILSKFSTRSTAERAVTSFTTCPSYQESTNWSQTQKWPLRLARGGVWKQPAPEIYAKFIQARKKLYYIMALALAEKRTTNEFRERLQPVQTQIFLFSRVFIMLTFKILFCNFLAEFVFSGENFCKRGF
jgi:hypothetical protein